MKKRYTKKQILESIKYWKKQLKKMNESEYVLSDREVANLFEKLVNKFGPKITSYLINMKIPGMAPNNVSNLNNEQKKAKLLGIILSCINSLKDLVYGSNREKMIKVFKYFINEAMYYSQIFDYNTWDIDTNNPKYNISISEERVGEIGQEIEQNISKAFIKAHKNKTSVIPGDPVVTDDNIDELQEDVLDKLFGGGNNPKKNDIGPQNAYNLYGDFIPCDFKTFEAFYNYVKENGY